MSSQSLLKYYHKCIQINKLLKIYEGDTALTYRLLNIYHYFSSLNIYQKFLRSL